MSYNKKIWANGDLITKEGMNNIEYGIYDAHDKIDSINNKVEENTTDTNTAKQDISDIKLQIGTEELTTTSKKIKGAINDLSSQIKEKANFNEVIKKGNVTLNDCTEEVLSAIQGGEGTSFELLSVPRNKSVSYKKTDFLKSGKNLFNKNDKYIIEDGYFYSQNNGVKNASDYHSTIFMDLEAGQTYSFSGLHPNQTYITQWNKSTYICGVKLSTSSTTITLDVNCTEVRISVYTTSLSTVQIELGDTVTTYEDYYEYLDEKVRYLGKIYGEEAALLEPIDRTTLEENNLFDPNHPDNLYNSNIGGNGNIGNMNGWMVTHYIPIETGMQLSAGAITKAISTSEGGMCIGYYQTYDKNKGNKSARLELPMTSPYVINCDRDGFIRFTFQYSENTKLYSKIRIAKTSNDDWKVPYTKFGYNMPLLNLTSENIPPSFYKWYNKKWVSIGDSNTSRRQYQKYVINELGLRWANHAEGGTDASYWANDEKLEAIINEEPDIITIMLGTNTGASDGVLPDPVNNNIGADDELDTSTYVGAIMYIVKYISTYKPKCQIILMTPPYAGGDKMFWAEGSSYNKGEILRKLARMLGCEFIDAYVVGANMWNYSPTYFENNGDAIHWGDLYGRRLARKIISKMKEMEPFE